MQWFFFFIHFAINSYNIFELCSVNFYTLRNNAQRYLCISVQCTPQSRVVYVQRIQLHKFSILFCGCNFIEPIVYNIHSNIIFALTIRMNGLFDACIQPIHVIVNGRAQSESCVCVHVMYMQIAEFLAERNIRHTVIKANN